MERFCAEKMHESVPELVPVVPTMDVVVFPHMIVPLLVVDDRIIRGINQALEGSKIALLLACKKATTDDQGIGTKDLYSVGTIASIMRVVQLPEGGIKILVQGIAKAHAHDISSSPELLQAKVEPLATSIDDEHEVNTLIRQIKQVAEKLSVSGQTLSPDFHLILSKMTDPDKIADFIISHLHLDVATSQMLLEQPDHLQLLQNLHMLLEKEFHVSQVQDKIRSATRDAMNQSQKEYYLREQLKAIKKELGEEEAEEIDQMRSKLETLPMPQECKSEVARQLNRLEKTAPDSMEATVLKNYLEWIFGLPWDAQTTDNLDLDHVKQVLDEDHYGLDEIKDRILDFISVRKLKEDGFTPILCFAGPPGTGKTSLGKSIAKSLNRSFYRISLGGVKDEAEIRGHRRTYVGAMPGRFIQAVRKAGTMNPVVVIDELDKIGADFRGDPSAAMLEVLDPHQNKTFYDNYLGMPFDLSKIIFIATANNVDAISEPLRDRMEIINLSGYTMQEKIAIVHKHILPKALLQTGLEGRSIPLNDAVIEDIIMNYTKESGVRQLERMIIKLFSKAAREYVEHQTIPLFDCATLEKHLGPRKFIDEFSHHESQVGVCNGLAWTPYGGEILKIEAVLMPGKGKLILTGSLGDVMKESAQAALSYIRSHAHDFGIDHKLFVTHDLHIHVPAGAVPKDGPSAGITILSAMLSALTNIPINAHVAMTGELNLQGNVMPIGGVKEKILAAKRHGLQQILLPRKNSHELKTIRHLLDDIEIILVDQAADVLERVLVSKPITKTAKAVKTI